MSELPPLAGADIIRDFVTRLPGKPGVYRMVDGKGDVIYVGKARSLKNRVIELHAVWRPHQPHRGDDRHTGSMEFVTTETEAEALLLEANLIKKLKPRYNVTLRDDKSFPYILIARTTRSRRSPSIAGRATTRAIITGRSPRQARSTARSTRCRRRSSSAPAATACSRTARGPACSTRSSAARRPAPARSTPEAYDELVREAEAFLAGKSQAVKAELAKHMEEASRAARFRAGGALPRPHPGDELRHLAAGHQPADVRGSATCSAWPRRAGRPASRCSSSAPGRTGATGPISRAPTRALARGGDPRLVPRPVLRRQAGAAADPAVA